MRISVSRDAGGLLLIGTLSMIGGPILAAPITFETALPVGQDEFVARGLLLDHKASDDPTPADRDLSVRGFMAALGYGVTSDFAVFGVLPYLNKELRLDTPGGRVTRKSSGVSDLRLFGRYTFYQQDAPGQTLRVAAFAGVEAPTGDDDQRDSQGRVPAPLQPGSGSWDGFAGLVGTFQTLDDQLDAQLAFQANREANAFEAGDEWHVDLSWQHRLLPRTLGAGLPDFLYGVLELNAVHRSKDTFNGAGDGSSGGTQVFLSPGLQYVAQRWIIEIVAQLPAMQNLNGVALEDDYALRAGVRFNF